MFKLIGTAFNVFIARPIFNLLIVILALIPGHDLGVAIIIFTVLIRFAMYPLLRKQLHHTMAMKKLQPELKRIKKEAAGDKQKESQMMMALYKEREINPFGSIGIIFIQLPILIGLYASITKLINEPDKILTYTYSFVHKLPYLHVLEGNIQNLQTHFLGLVDLARPALSDKGFYFPAMVLVVLSVAIQYIQSKQLMMTDKNARSIRQIMKDTAAGKEVDQAEVQAATSKLTMFFIPGMLFFIAVRLAPALSLYWFVGGVVAYLQQSRILKQDVEEMEASVDAVPVEAEIITKKPKQNTSKKKRKASKRRR